MNQPTLLFIQDNLNSSVPELALKKAPQGVDLPLALQQIKARQLLKTKLPDWANNPNLLFPVHLSVEQASSQLTAQYKQQLAQGQSMVDLTGGMGVDCYYLAQNFKHAYYVEQQDALCQMAMHNFALIAPHITVHHLTAEQYLQSLTHTDFIYLDPARRDKDGRKTVRISDCTPDLTSIQEFLLEKSNKVLVKLSPMLDLSLAVADLKHVCQVHILSVDNECKELLFMLDPDYREEPQIICANLQRNGQHQISPAQLRSTEQALEITYTNTLGQYLYEPNTSLLKAGFFKATAQRYNISKLNPSSHLYTSNQPIDNFEGRSFQIIAAAPFSNKGKKELLNNIKAANITCRNFPISVNELRKQLKLADGGAYYLFATTLANGEKELILCKKYPA